MVIALPALARLAEAGIALPLPLSLAGGVVIGLIGALLGLIARPFSLLAFFLPVRGGLSV